MVQLSKEVNSEILDKMYLTLGQLVDWINLGQASQYPMPPNLVAIINKVSQYESKISNLENTIQILHNKVNTDINSLIITINTLNEKIINLESSLQDNNTIGLLKSKMNDLDENLTNTQQSISTIESELKTLRTYDYFDHNYISTLIDNKINEASDKPLRSVVDSVNQLKGDIQKIKDLESKPRDNYRAINENIEAQLTGIKDRLKKLETTTNDNLNSAIRSTTNIINNRISETSQKVSEIEGKTNNLINNIPLDIKQDIKHIKEQLQGINNEHDGIEVKQLKVEVNDLNKKVRLLSESGVYSDNQNISAYQSDILDLKKRITNIEDHSRSFAENVYREIQSLKNNIQESSSISNVEQSIPEPNLTQDELRRKIDTILDNDAY